MAKEIEIKLAIRDLKVFQRKVKKIGGKPARPGHGRVHEFNVIFDTPDGGLSKHGQLLRIRMETEEGSGKKNVPNRVLLTFKQPTVRGKSEDGGRFKEREEAEVEVADSAALAKIFEGLGLRGWFSYEKYRTTWKLGAAARWAKDLKIELDETPVGIFAELEGPAEAIDRAAEALGYSRKDYLQKDYLTLYAEDRRRRGEPPGNMLFASPKKK